MPHEKIRLLFLWGWSWHVFELTTSEESLHITFKVVLIMAIPVADQVFFSDGGSGQSQRGGGALTYYLAKFRRKLHENEENWTQRGRRVASKSWLYRSATAFGKWCWFTDCSSRAVPPEEIGAWLEFIAYMVYLHLVAGGNVQTCPRQSRADRLPALSGPKISWHSHHSGTKYEFINIL